jgi:hypothetical protein
MRSSPRGRTLNRVSHMSAAMHDYTVQRIHEGRMQDLEREADQSALAAIARKGRTRRRSPAAAAWLWLSALLSRQSGSRGGNPQPNSLGGGFRPPAHAELAEDV